MEPPKPPEAAGQPIGANYKFREMKMHASDEWMADATKKYRRVFDRYEITYMYVEFSVFNKLFDEAEWEGSFRTKCFSINGSQKNEICNQEEKRKVLKEENIVYLRHSWGNPNKGVFWQKGTYLWEGYVDDVKIGETKFYVEDVGEAKAGENLYFDITSIKLFEGNGQASTLPQKTYVTQFSQKDTRYVWCEFIFTNKSPKDYFLELFFNFYDEAGQTKGISPYLMYVSPNTAGQPYTIFNGWGGETPARWLSELYSIDIVFNDQLIATVPFRVGEGFIEGAPVVITDPAILAKTGGSAIPGNLIKTNEEILKDALAELDALTGLTQIKTEVNEMVKLVQFYQEMEKDPLNRFSLHSAFIGNPGTGKTTVARILSRIYQGLGILAKGHLVEVDREGLVAGYVGQTAIKTGEKINEAMGGILFIDEAYSLAGGRGSPYDFGGEAIQVILKRMEDHRGKFGVIVAGYTQNMHDFINSNPGLKSRFDKYFIFPDYSPDEMMIIALSMYRKEGVMPDEEAAVHLKKYFDFLFKRRDEHFGNARTVRQVVLESVKNQNLRLASIKKEERTPELINTVIYADVAEFELKELDFGPGKIGFKTGKE